MHSVTAAVAITVFFASGTGKEVYVTPTGTGSESSNAPFGSIQSAVDAAGAGDVIHLRSGTYKPITNVQITKSGNVTPTQPITLRSYGNEKVTIDGENMSGR